MAEVTVVKDLDRVVTLQDFTFRMGTDATPNDWPAAPTPVAFDFEPGGGVGGADRVVVTFADGAIRGTWLQATIAGEHLGLPADDVFYFGSLPGETGDATGEFAVSAADVLQVRTELTGPGATVGADDVYDFNRDARVDAVDLLIARDSVGATLPQFAAPGAAAAKSLAPPAELAWWFEAERSTDDESSKETAVDVILATTGV